MSSFARPESDAGPPQSEATGTSKGSLAVLFLTVVVDLLGFGMVMPLLAIYADQFATDEGGWTIGLLMASFSAMQFLFAPIWGMLSDRIGRRPILMAGLAGSVVAYSVLAWGSYIDSLFLLFVSRIGAGIAGATIPTAQAYIADTTSPGKRAHVMAIIGMAMGVGFTFGPLLGYLALPSGEGHPGPWPGIVAAGLSLTALAMAYFRLPESKPPGVQSTARKWIDVAGLQTALARRYLWMLMGGYLITVLAFVQFESTLSLLLYRSEHGAATTPFDFTWRNMMLAFALIGLTIAVVQGGLVRPLTRKMAEMPMLMTGFCLEIGSFLAVAASIYLESVPLLFVSLVAVAVGFSFMQPPLHALVSLWTPAERQGSVLGFAQSLNAIARIAGSAIGIPLLKKSTALPYYSASFLILVAMGMVLVAARWKRSDADEPRS